MYVQMCMHFCMPYLHVQSLKLAVQIYDMNVEKARHLHKLLANLQMQFQ